MLAPHDPTLVVEACNLRAVDHLALGVSILESVSDLFLVPRICATKNHREAASVQGTQISELLP